MMLQMSGTSRMCLMMLVGFTCAKLASSSAVLSTRSFLAKQPETVGDPNKLESSTSVQEWEQNLEKRLDSLFQRPPQYKLVAFEAGVTWAIWLTLSLLFWALLYPDEPDVKMSEMEVESFERDPVKTFTARHFGCFKTPMITICACFCPALRWADTINLAGIMRFRSAFAAFAFCALLNGLTYNSSLIYGIFTWALIVHCRQKLRARLNLANWTCFSCCCDIFYVFFCTCCAIAQEARVVRYAYEQSVVGVPSTRANTGNSFALSASLPTQALLQQPVLTWQSPAPVRQQFGPYGST